MKVSRTQIPAHYNEFRKTIQDYSGERNTIVHRHSYLDQQLRKIQVFYNEILTKDILEDPEDADNFKHLRRKMLTEFISDRKKEYRETNEKCFEKMLPILDELKIHYEATKEKLK